MIRFILVILTAFSVSDSVDPGASCSASDPEEKAGGL